MRKLYEQCLSQTQFSVLNFEQIFQLSQKRLKRELKAELIASGYTVQKQKGFLYAAGTLPVLLVAHLDTVHRTQPETICYSADGTVMMSPQGIGGDDRAGVYMILRLIQSCHCHVLFCEDEETGGHGARAFTKSGIKPDVNYIGGVGSHGQQRRGILSMPQPAVRATYQQLWIPDSVRKLQRHFHFGTASESCRGQPQHRLLPCAPAGRICPVGQGGGVDRPHSETPANENRTVFLHAEVYGKKAG